MGWLFTYKDPAMSTREFFEHKFPSMEFLATATTSGEFYAACRRRAGDGHSAGEVFGLICLVKRARGPYNFGYKDTDEAMGPFVANCPARVLDVLDRLAPVAPTPARAEDRFPPYGAYEWRKKCRETLVRKRKIGQLRDGDVIRLEQSIRFVGGEELDAFRVVKVGRTLRFVALGDPFQGAYYRVRPTLERSGNWAVASA